MQMKLFTILILQVLCMLGISFLTSYELPDLSEANWDTVLFLTPMGILKNLLDKNPVMKSFYADYAKGQGTLSFSKAIFLVFIIVFLIGIFWKIASLLPKKDH